MNSYPLFALIAGEDSGDQLGAELITALRACYPRARFAGIGGKRMQAVGFESWYDIKELSLFGLTEVLRHLPRLLRLRKALIARLLLERADVVIGIDAPDFNLEVERRLKLAGLTTVHYVSPSVWAWRAHRAAKIGQSAHRVLCLFPMEPPIYARYGVEARFVGHPLADRFPRQPDREAARAALHLPMDVPVLAVLPGSRMSEIARLAAPFLEAARLVAAEIPKLRIVVPAANARCHEILRASLPSSEAELPCPLLLNGQAHAALQAADVVLIASGTATLEAMLAKRPMVVGYRVSPVSYHLARLLKLLKTDVYSLPNILARATNLSTQPVVPELMQKACTAENLAAATIGMFRDGGRRDAIVDVFQRLHAVLHGGLEGSAATHAAQAIRELLP